MNLYNQYPTLDLHGFDRDYARIMINDFITDCYIMQEEKAIIIHGIGSGILRKTTKEKVVDGEHVDISKVDAIAFDPFTHGYYKVGERVGEAFKDGFKLKK